MLVKIILNFLDYIFRFFSKKEKEKNIIIYSHLYDAIRYDDIVIKNIESKLYVTEFKIPSKINKQAKKSLSYKNAGGNSDISEMYSMDFFIKKYKATEFIFEKNIKYWVEYKMVDFICSINKERVGVSVTRAMEYDKTFDYKDANKLLDKKIQGLVIARNSVVKSQCFNKSYLHIWCQNSNIKNILEDSFNCYRDLNDLKELDVILTVCSDYRIYKNLK